MRRSLTFIMCAALLFGCGKPKPGADMMGAEDMTSTDDLAGNPVDLATPDLATPDLATPDLATRAMRETVATRAIPSRLVASRLFLAGCVLLRLDGLRLLDGGRGRRRGRRGLLARAAHERATRLTRGRGAALRRRDPRAAHVDHPRRPRRRIGLGGRRRGRGFGARRLGCRTRMRGVRGAGAGARSAGRHGRDA